jgi:hypothetical protein
VRVRHLPGGRRHRRRGRRTALGTCRPVTATGRPAPTATRRPGDRTREPLLDTPAHTDHLSGHATTGRALTRTLTEVLGTPQADPRIRSATTGTTRNDRERAFRVTTRPADEVGNATGRGLAARALRDALPPGSPTTLGPRRNGAGHRDPAPENDCHRATVVAYSTIDRCLTMP